MGQAKQTHGYTVTLNTATLKQRTWVKQNKNTVTPKKQKHGSSKTNTLLHLKNKEHDSSKAKTRLQLKNKQHGSSKTNTVTL